MKVTKPDFNEFVKQYLNDTKVEQMEFQELSYMTQVNLIESYKGLPESMEIQLKGEINV